MHVDDKDPKPSVTAPQTCRRCGGRWPYLAGLCGYCTAYLKSIDAKVATAIAETTEEMREETPGEFE